MNHGIASGASDVPPSGRLGGIGAHTDLSVPSWFNWLPERWEPYLLLARMDRPIGTWLLYLPSVWGIFLARQPAWPTLRLLVLFGIGSVAMRGAGCVVNDMWDRDIDRQVPRTASRPLAAGTVSMRQAMGFLAILLLMGLIVLLQLPPLCWVLGVASLGPVALYPAAKRVTNWPQAVLGLVFGFGAPMGYAAAHDSLGGPLWAVYAASLAWALSYDTIYAHQDREADAMLGLGSSALQLGRATRPFLLVCNAGLLAALLVAGRWAGFGPVLLPALLPAAGLLVWQALRVDIDNPALCLALFRISRNIGLLIAAACWIGWLV